MEKQDISGRPVIRFPPPIAFFGVFLVMWAIDYWLTGWRLPIDDAVRWGVGASFLLIGVALIFPALRGFFKAKENPEPWTPSNTLIVEGLYRYTRNPMYLGMALAYMGLAICARSPSAFIALPALIWLIQTKVIAREETYLLDRFGDQYAAYMKRVRRWI